MVRLPDIPLDSWIQDQQEIFQQRIAGYDDATEFDDAMSSRVDVIPTTDNSDQTDQLIQQNQQWEEQDRQRREAEQRRLQEQQAQAAELQQQEAERQREEMLAQQARDTASSFGIPSPSDIGNFFSGLIGSRDNPTSDAEVAAQQPQPVTYGASGDDTSGMQPPAPVLPPPTQDESIYGQPVNPQPDLQASPLPDLQQFAQNVDEISKPLIGPVEDSRSGLEKIQDWGQGVDTRINDILERHRAPIEEQYQAEQAKTDPNSVGANIPLGAGLTPLTIRQMQEGKRAVALATALVQSIPEVSTETLDSMLRPLGYDKENFGIDTPMGRMGLADAALTFAPGKLQALMAAGTGFNHVPGMGTVDVPAMRKLIGEGPIANEAAGYGQGVAGAIERGVGRGLTGIKDAVVGGLGEAARVAGPAVEGLGQSAIDAATKVDQAGGRAWDELGNVLSSGAGYARRYPEAAAGLATAAVSKALSPQDDSQSNSGSAGLGAAVAGGVALTRPRTLAGEAEKAPVFYSVLRNEIEKRMPKVATPDNIMSILGYGTDKKGNPIKSGPVKEEEIKWTGLDDWLKEQTGPISKQDVLDFIDSHRIQVEETVNGQPEVLPEPKWTQIDDNLYHIEVPGYPESSHTVQILHPGDRPYEGVGHWLPDAVDNRQPVFEVRGERPNSNYWDEGDSIPTYYSTPDEVLQAIQQSIRSSPQYSEYVQRGGKNYRELLLHLPPSERMTDSSEGMRQAREEVGNLLDTVGLPQHPTRFELEEQFGPQEATRIQNILMGVSSDTVPDYTGGHWNTPNVLAHVRFDERTAPDGKRVLHIDEIQSDWHQEGRAEGYHTPETRQAQQTELAQYNALRQRAQELHRQRDAILLENNYRYYRPGSEHDPAVIDLDNKINALYEQLDSLRENPEPTRAEMSMADQLRNRIDILSQQYEDLRIDPRIREIDAQLDPINEQLRMGRPANYDNMVPAGPYEKSWPELAIKRMIRYAADNGYDRVTWEPGETHSNRWTTQRIDWRPGAKPGEYEVIASASVRPGTIPVVGDWESERQLVSTPAELKALLDKQYGMYGNRNQPGTREVAEGRDLPTKLWQAMQEQPEGGSFEPRTAGMAGFYDSALPNTVNKLTKKFGATVQKVEIPNPTRSRVSGWDVLNPDGTIYLSNLPTQERAEWYVRQLGDRYSVRSPQDTGPSPTRQVWGVDITPEMKQTATEQGFPQFVAMPPGLAESAGGAAIGGVTGAASDDNQDESTGPSRALTGAVLGAGAVKAVRALPKYGPWAEKLGGGPLIPEGAIAEHAAAIRSAYQAAVESVSDLLGAKAVGKRMRLKKIADAAYNAYRQAVEGNYEDAPSRFPERSPEQLAADRVLAGDGLPSPVETLAENGPRRAVGTPGEPTPSAGERVGDQGSADTSIRPGDGDVSSDSAVTTEPSSADAVAQATQALDDFSQRMDAKYPDSDWNLQDGVLSPTEQQTFESLLQNRNAAEQGHFQPHGGYTEDVSFDPEMLPDTLNPREPVSRDRLAEFIDTLREQYSGNDRVTNTINRLVTNLSTQVAEPRMRHLEQILETIAQHPSNPQRVLGRHDLPAMEAKGWADNWFRENGFLAPKTPDAPADQTQLLGGFSPLGSTLGAAGGATVGAVEGQDTENDDYEVPLDRMIPGAIAGTIFGRRGAGQVIRNAALEADPKLKMLATPTINQNTAGLVEKIHDAWRNKIVPALGDDIAALQGFQNDLAKIYHQATGSQLPAEVLAAEMKRFDSSRSYEMTVNRMLKPALQAVDNLQLPLLSINGKLVDGMGQMDAYLGHMMDMDVARSTGNGMRSFPGQGGSSYGDSLRYTQNLEDHILQTKGPQALAEFKSTAQQIWDFGDHILQTLRDGGLIDQQTYADLRTKYPHYMPTKLVKYLRDGDFVGAGSNRTLSINSNTLHELTKQGTEDEASSYIAALLGSGRQAYSAAAKNQVYTAFVGMWNEANELEQQGLIPASMMGDRLRRYAGGINPVANTYTPSEGEVTITGFLNGLKQKFAVSKELGDLTSYASPVSIPILSGMMSAFRAGATARNPVFLTANMILDLATFASREIAREGGPTPQNIGKVFAAWGMAAHEFLPLMTAGGVLAGGVVGALSTNKDDSGYAAAGKVGAGLLVGGLAGAAIDRKTVPHIFEDIANHEYRGDMYRFLQQGGGTSGGYYDTSLRRVDPLNPGKWIGGRVDLNSILERWAPGWNHSPLEKEINELRRQSAVEIRSPADAVRLLKDIALLKPVEALGERIELVPRVAAMRLAEDKAAPRLAALQQELQTQTQALQNLPAGQQLVGRHPRDVAAELDDARWRSQIEGTQAGRTTTIDFNKGGTWSRFINQIIPFFNVGVQAAVDTPRMIHENGWKTTTATLGTAVVVPTLAAEIWNNRDEQTAKDYAEVPAYIKDQGIVVMLPREIFPPSVDQQGNERPQFFHWRERHLAPLSIATREFMQRTFYSGTPSDANRRGVFEAFMGALDQVSPVGGIGKAVEGEPQELLTNLTPPLVSAGTQAAFNEDTFRGARINSKFADERASPLSKGIAGFTGMRPSTVEFLSRDLFTGYAGMLHGASNILYGKPAETSYDTPFIGGLTSRFTKGSIGEGATRAEKEILSPETEAILKREGIDWRPGPVSFELDQTPLTRQQLAIYQRAVTKRIDEGVKLLGNDPGWRSMNASDKKLVLDSVVGGYRELAKADFYNNVDINKWVSQQNKALTSR